MIFESNVHGKYIFSNGSGLVEDELYGLTKVGDEVTVSQNSVAMGFDFGAPPEPTVRIYVSGKGWLLKVCLCVCVVWGGGAQGTKICKSLQIICWKNGVSISF